MQVKSPIFRAFWVAGLLSTIGSWVHLVAAGWQMTTLTHSAAPVALLLTVTSVPAFLLALPAGALADVVDRRLLIIVTQAGQAVVAAVLGVVSLAGAMTPTLLLVLTLLLATSGTLATPVMQAVVAELVPREQLPAAVGLGATSFTLSQAVGPALGGVLVAVAGPGPAFLVNAVSFLAVIVVAAAWRRERPIAAMPPEHLLGAVRAGARYVRNAPALRVVLGRAVAYALCFTALPALLAQISRVQLGASAAQYGLMLGALGVGGLAGTLLLPRLRGRFDHERLVMVAMLGYAAAFATLSQLTAVGPALAVLVCAGLAGMTTMSTLNIAAQSVLPDWVRGRGLAVYQLAFALAMAAGAAGWGLVASLAGLRVVMLAAAVGLLVNILLATRVRLTVAEGVDTAPLHLDLPNLDARLDPADGPVLVTVDYRVASSDLAAFLAAMRPIRTIRRRDGAMQWGLYGSLDDAGLQREAFVIASRAEYERLAERAILADSAHLERVRSLASESRTYLGHHFPARLSVRTTGEVSSSRTPSRGATRSVR
ncbi:MFS transporter [Nonomuraea sp. NPDC050556]|uniref:MFS transporter n=1 Tax=Nonomuraea sp. NPDC050556 TaxID=3364369 RepID=UPI00379CB304